MRGERTRGDWLDAVKWQTADGLVPAIAQDARRAY